MGCGILFPRDYSAQADCGPTRVCDLCEDLLTKAGEDEDNCHSSESEDEEWWERPYAESGTRVQVGEQSQDCLQSACSTRVFGFSTQLHFPLVAMLTFCMIIRKLDHKKF